MSYLKLCPFCGGVAELEKSSVCAGHGEYYDCVFVKCQKCGAKGGTAYSREIKKSDMEAYAVGNWNKRVKEAENEELQHKISSCNSKIERLQKVIETMTNEQLQFAFEVKNKIVQARKEFAEKLKEKATYYRCRDGIKYAVSISDIDNLLKEMEG